LTEAQSKRRRFALALARVARVISSKVLHNKTKQCRRIAARYDKLAANYLACIDPAAIRIWLQTYEPTPWFSWQSRFGAGFPLKRE